MNPQITIKHNIGNTLTIFNKVDIRAYTYTTTNTLIGATALPIENGFDLTSGMAIFLLLSTIGTENAEIVTSTAHTTISATISAQIQNHARGEIVQQIKWDKVQVWKSSTVNGTYVQLGSDLPIQVTQMNTTVFDATGLTSDYYKVRYFNSLTSTASDYTTPQSVLSYPTISPGYMFQSIRTMFGLKEDDKQITTDFLLTALNDARTFMSSKLYGIRQPWQQHFNYPIKVLSGRNYMELPDDIDFELTDQSLLAARFVLNNSYIPFNLRYCDKRMWNQLSYNSTGGITSSSILIGATSIPLNSVGDFAIGGGSAQVATTDFTQVQMQIQYTSIDFNTNELLGVTGVTRNVPSGTQIWARTNTSQPIWYTAFDGKIWFNSIIGDSMQGMNCYIDYYKKMVPIDDLYTEIPEHYREMYKPYIRWSIKYRKDITLPTSDPDLVKFNDNITSVFNNLYSGQDTMIITN